jgi:dihydrofolate reductase
VTVRASLDVGRTALTLQPISLVLIAAVAENGVIGRDNRLPWRLKSDMRHFRRVTIGKPVVMGRRTFQSLMQPLKGRTTIVVSRDRAFTAPGAIVAPSLEAALAAARGEALRRGADAIMVAGGGSIYAQAMPLADRLLITLVHARCDGDTAFPVIDRIIWREVDRAEHPAGSEDGADFAFVRFERATPPSSGGSNAGPAIGVDRP